jgi:hypothetical protein
MKSKTQFYGQLCALALGVVLTTAAFAQQRQTVALNINNARGVDATVDYTRLTQYGPWDDRNYKLTAKDLTWLAKNEADLDDRSRHFSACSCARVSAWRSRSIR